MVDLYEAKKKLFSIHATIKGYPEIKKKVKEATNLDPWGPTREQCQEISDASQNHEDRRLIMKALWKRITTSQTKEWPHIYKALAVIEFLLLNGPESINAEVKEQLYNLRTLHDFQAFDEKGQDRGHAVREKSKKLVEWVTSPQVLYDEKHKKDACKTKFVGISSEGTTVPSSYGTKDRLDSESTARSRFDNEHSSHSRFETDEFDPPIVKEKKEMRPLTPPQEHALPQPVAVVVPKKTAPVVPITSHPAPVVSQQPPKPQAPKPQPQPEEIFDPFADLPPPAPKMPNDISDFFSNAGVAPVSNQHHAFAAAREEEKEEDFFAPSHQQQVSSNEVDFFSSSNGNGETTQHQEESFFPEEAAQPKSMFEDSNFGTLCSMDRLAISKQQAQQASVSPKPAGMSLKEMRAMQQQPKPAASQPQRPMQTNSQAFNPFM